MVKIEETDERITLEKQLDEDVGPIVVMNTFNVDPQEVDEFLQVFAKTTEKFKQQPGFISAQLHRGIAGSTTFFNYVVWESTAHFKHAFIRMDAIITSSQVAWDQAYLIYEQERKKKV